MMQAYMIVRMYLREGDTDWADEYLDKVPPILRSFGGEYLFMSQRIERVEGDDPMPDYITVFTFPSLEKIKEFMNCEAYKPYKTLRLAHSSASIFGVEAE
jgi:uncharacterized protein (DUF1330 family)